MACSQCQGAALDGGPCQPCGAGVHFSAGPSGLTAPSVRVDGLETHANYTFNVEAQNGVSGLGASKPASASLSINMGSAGEGPGGQQGLEKMGGGGGIGPWGQVDGWKASRSYLSDFLPLNSQSPCQACP